MTTTTSRRAILAGAAILPVTSLPALAVPRSEWWIIPTLS